MKNLLRRLFQSLFLQAYKKKARRRGPLSFDLLEDRLAPASSADLQITIADNRGGSSLASSVGSALPGNSIIYTIVVTNAGPNNAAGIAVADTWPGQLTGVSYTASGAGNASAFTATGTSNINDQAVNLPAGSTIAYTVQATIAASDTDPIANTATVTAPAGVSDPNLQNNSATDTVTVPPIIGLANTRNFYIDSQGMFEGFFGENEKWLRGNTNSFGNTWYFITTAGDLFESNGLPGLGGNFLAALGTSAWDNPELVVDADTLTAANPEQVQAAAQVRGFFRSSTGDYYLNALGGNEKWIEGLISAKATADQNNPWYYVLPNGSVYEWSGNGLTGTLVTTITPDVNLYKEPSLLYDGFQDDSVNSQGFAEQLHFYFDRSEGLVRNLWENWSGTADEKWFRGDTNQFGNPWYFTLPSGALYAWNGQRSATGAVLGQLGADAWSDIERVVSDYQPAPTQTLITLAQQHGLFRASNDSNFYFNYYGQQEKWLRGFNNSFNNSWYFILPNGNLEEWNGTAAAAGIVLASNLPAEVYDDPLILADAYTGSSVLASATKLNPFAPVAPTITLNTPASGLVTNGNITVTGQVSDNQSDVASLAGVQDGVASLAVSLDDGAPSNITFSPSGSFSFTTTLPLDHSADGQDTLQFQATDNAGNVSLPASYSFTLDTVPPLITITSPSANVIANSNITVTGTVSDAASGVASLQEALDSSSGPFTPLTVTNGSFGFTTTLATDGSADGAHTVYLKATDNAGNVAPVASLPFTLTTTNQLSTPTLDPASDSGPEQNGITNVTKPLIHLASKSGLDVSLLVNGQFAQQAVSVNGSADFTLGPLTDGTYSIVAALETSPGNFIDSSNALSIKILTTPPPAPTFELAAGTADLGPEMTSSGHVTLVGQVGPGDMVTLVGTGLSALASGTGTFQVPGVTLVSGANSLTLQAEDPAGNTTNSAPLTVTYTPPTTATPPNAVIFWNQATLNAIQTDGTDPVMASRALAMVQAAVYDAVNNIEGTPAYYIKVSAPADSSANAAVDAAAHDVLVYLYPAQQANLDSQLASELALLPSGQGTTDGETVGQAVGNAIIALRANDGSKDFVDFTPGTATGDWQPTAPSYAPALDPQWGNITPFALTSDSQFNPAGPPALTSQQWADAVNQVESLGAVNSTTRTSAQTTLAQFWNDGIGTDTPSGHWNVIAQTVAQQEGDSLVDDARLFAELNISMADAGIATWNTKFLYDTWRPVTVIQSGGAGVNPAVTADPTWTSFLTNPNFPEYVSGHSAFSMAAATVLDAVFADNVTFTTTEPTTALSLTYTSFQQAATDAGMSRLYGGIHFLFSIQDGWALGAAVANWDLATFNVAKDTTPPKVTLNTILPGGASKTNVTITGQVTDNLSGVASLAVQVDGGSYTPLAFNATTDQFSYPTTFALDGSADGTHTINFQATDNAGNVAAPVSFTFGLGTQSPTLTVTSLTNGGPLSNGSLLTGSASGGGVALVGLTYSFDAGTTMPVAFNADGSFSQALDLSNLTAGEHSLVVTALDAAGNSTTQTLILILAAPIPLECNITPAAGSSDVSVTFRPVVTFSRPIDTTTLSSSNFYATDTTGATIPATIVPATDGLSATMFFTNPLPSSSTVLLTVDGSTIKAADGSLLDAAADGTPGSTLTSTFTTVSTAAVPGTSITGIVADPGPDGQPGTRDDVRAGPDGILGTADDIYLFPIAGATVYILGLENEAVTSAANGSFSLTNIPSGDVKLVIDGTTATNAPAGVYYPQMVLDLTVQPGVVNTVMGDMGTLDEQEAMGTALGVYLPRLQTNILQPAGGNTPTTITLNSDAAASNLTAQQASEYSITVAPNSLIGLNGQPMSSGMVGFSTVNPSLIREMLPQGVMQLATTLTIQAPGVATFTTPLQVTFANVYGAAPGSQLDVYSFNHTTGTLEITGTATVSPDGLTVTTDPGSGITHPGWFGVTPPGDCGGGSAPSQPTPPTPSDATEELPPIDLGLSDDPGESSLSTAAGPSIDPDVLGGNGFASDSFTITFEPPPLQPGETPVTTPSGCPPIPPPPPTTGIQEIDYTVTSDGYLSLFMNTSGSAVGNNFAPEANLPPGFPVQISAAPVSFSLRPGDTAKTFSATDMSYYQMLGPAGLAAINTNRLYGAEITVTKTVVLTNGSHDTPTVQPYYRYRFVDATGASMVVNDNGVTVTVGNPNANKGTLAFPDTLTNSGVTRTLPLTIMASTDSQPTVKLSDSSTNEDDFTVTQSGNSVTLQYSPVDNLGPSDAPGNDQAQLEIDPPVGSPVNINLQGYCYAPMNLSVSSADIISALTANGYGTAATDAPIAAEIILQATADLSGFGTGITVNGSNVGNTVVVNFTAPGPPIVVNPNGTRSGTVGVDPSIDNEADLLALLQHANQYNQYQQAYLLAESLNQSTAPKTTIVYVNNLIKFLGFRDFLETGIANTIAHEFGHSVGLVHTGSLTKGKPPIVINGISGVNDLMYQGMVGGPRSFLPGMTAEALSIALKMNWTVPQTQTALSYYLQNLAQAGGGDFFQTDQDDDDTITGPQIVEQSTAVPSPNPTVQPADDSTITNPELLIFNQSGEVFNSGYAFGDVPVDTTGNSPVDEDLTIGNGGTNNLVLSSVGIVNAGTPFTVSGVTAGEVVQPDNTVQVQITFDPTTSGNFSDDLQIVSNDPNSPANIELTGTGISSTPSAQLSLGNNNLGGAAVGSLVQSPDLATITNNGAQPLTISSVLVEPNGSSFTLIGVPANLASNPITLTAGQIFTFGVEYTASEVGPERAKIDVTTNDPNNSVLTFGVLGTGLASVVYPHWGNDYVAIEFPNLNNEILRTVSDASGNFSFFLPPNQQYHVAVFDPITGLIANGYGITPPSGTGVDLSDELVFGASTGPDNVYGALPTDVAFAVGTNPNNAFTIGAGIDDFTRIITDHASTLSGTPLATGVIATLPLSGSAQDVTLVGSTNSTSGQTAYVATGSYGLAIVNASNFEKPILLGQLQLPGNSIGIAVDSSLDITVVASTTELNLVDVSDPTNPKLLETLDIPAEAVKIDDGVAYVANGSQVTMVDLLSGATLDQESFSGGTIDDLSITQGALYVLASAGYASHTVYKVELNGLSMQQPAYSLTVTGHPTFGRMYLDAAGGYIYVGASDNNDSQEVPGIEVIQDTGTALNYVGPSSAITAFNVTVNSNRLALCTGGLQFSSEVELLDLSDPTNTDTVVTTFNTSGTAEAIAIGDGIAFVADGSGGLDVLNYLPFDTTGIAPTASISLPAASVLGTAPNGNPEVVEGATLPILATATSNVQVRNVELLVNGQVVQNAVSFPFNLSVVAPAIVAGSNTFTLQVLAYDTGGNVGASNILTVQLEPDTVPPTLVTTNLPNGQVVGSHFHTVTLQFSKSMNESTFTSSSVYLLGPGNTIIAPTGFQFRTEDRFVQVTLPQLAVGDYQLVLGASAITDRVGNALGNALVQTQFTVKPFSAAWINPGGGDWNNPANWDTGVVPGPTDDVLINVPGNAVITISTGAQQVNSLLSENPLSITGGSLQVAQTIEVDNTFTLAGGSLVGAHILRGTGGQGLTVADNSYSATPTLDGVTSDANITVSAYESYYGGLNIVNGLTLNGNLTQQSGTLTFSGSQTLAGTGTLTPTALSVPSGSTLTIGSGITIKGGSISGDTIINQGTIDTNNAAMTLSMGSFTNQGSLNVTNGSLAITGLTGNLSSLAFTGGSLSLGGTNYVIGSSLSIGTGQTLTLTGTWSTAAGVTLTANGGTLGLGTPNSTKAWTAGTVTVSNGTLDLGGTAASLAGLSVTASALNIVSTYTATELQSLLTGNTVGIGTGGVFDNTGNTLTLDANTGNLTLSGGTLKGGTVTASGGAKLIVSGPYGTSSTLDGVTLNSDLDLSAEYASATVLDGLTLNGAATVGGSSGYYSTLTFSGTQTLGGTGSVALGSGYGTALSIGSGATLTLGPNITIDGSGSINNGTLVNQGTIAADVSGAKLTVSVSSLQNQGTLQAAGGGDLAVSGLTASLGTVSITGTNSALSVDGTGYTVDSSLAVSNGQSLTLTGTWTTGTGVTLTASNATLGLGTPNSTKAWTAGTVTVTSGTLNLGGSATSLAGISLTGSTLTVLASYTTTQLQPLLAGNHLAIGTGGTLDNTANTLSLDATTGNLILSGGTLKAGTVSASGGAKVVVTSSGSTLDGVTLNSDLDLSASYTSATVLDGLTLNGTATLGNSSGYSTLTLSGSQTLGGTGAIALGNSNDSLSIGSSATLTIGSGITVHGGGTISGYYYGSSTLVNEGMVAADVSGATLMVNYSSLQNQGTLEAMGGGKLAVSGLTGSLGAVTISGVNSALSVDGTNYTVDSSLSVSSGQSLTLTGTWTTGTGVTVTASNATLGLGTPNSTKAWTAGSVIATSSTVNLGGSATSLAGMSLTASTLTVLGSYTTTQLQPLLVGTHLGIGTGGTLDNTGNTITLDASTGNLTLSGGTLKAGTVSASGGAKVVVTGSGSTLGGVTLNSDLDLSASYTSATVLDGLTLNGTATLGYVSTLTFTGTQTLGGTGTVDLAGIYGSSLSVGYSTTSTTLTLGSNITVHGSGTISGYYSGGSSLINQATIAADVSGATLTVSYFSLQNQGTLEAAGGGKLAVSGLTGSLGTVAITGANSALSVDGTGYTVDSSLAVSNGQSLTLTGTWTTGSGVTLTASNATLGLGTPNSTKAWTAGAVTVTGSTFNLGGSATSLAAMSLADSTLTVLGSYTTPQLQPLLSGNHLAIGSGGTLDNTGNTLTLDASTGNLTLSGGTLKAGTISASGGAKVVVTSYGSTLDGVTLNSDLDLSASSTSATVLDGLTLNGTAILGSSSGYGSTLTFTGTQTLGGTGTVDLAGTYGSYLSVGYSTASTTLTLGSNITVHGSGNISGYSSSSSSLVNQGTIAADVSGASLAISGFSLQNQGRLKVAGGGDLTVNGLTGSLGTVAIADANSALSVDGTGYTVDSSLAVSNGQSLTLTGTWTTGTSVTVTANNATLGLGTLGSNNAWTAGTVTVSNGTLNLGGAATSLAGLSVTASTLNIVSTYTITELQGLLTGNTVSIGSGGTLDNTGNTLTLDASTGNLTLSGGTLKAGTVNASGGAKVVVTGSGSTLDSVTLNSDLDLSTSSASATVLDGLTLNGTANLGNSSGYGSTLTFTGTQTLGGTGTVDLAGTYGSYLSVGYSTTLTLGSNITVHGSGTISGYYSSSSILVNQGTIAADVSGATVTVSGSSLQNQGTFKAAGGGDLAVSGLTGSLGTVAITGANSALSVDGTGYTVDSSLAVGGGQSLTLTGTWTTGTGVTLTASNATLGLGTPRSTNAWTAGTVTVSNGTLNLGGAATALAGLSLTASTLNIVSSYTVTELEGLLTGNIISIGTGGTLDNTGNTLTLDAATGNLTLSGGTLKGGTVTASGGAKVVVTGGSTLDGVTLNSDLDLSASSTSATVLDGLTLDGTATVGNATGQATASLSFTGNQTLAGNGTVKFGAGSAMSGTNELQVSYGNTLTIASGITITGDSGTIGGNGSLVNQGTIDADGSSSSITFNLSSFVNQGTIEATNGGGLTVAGLSSGLGTVALTGANSSLSLNGTNYTVDSSFSISNGQTLALLGSWTAAPGVTLSATDGTFGLGNTSSLGVITLTNSVLSVDGNYMIAVLQPLLAGNSLAVGQGGVLDNTGNTITLNATTGSLTLDGGTLLGGTVTASGGAKVLVTDSGSVLDGVTLNSDLDMTAAGASATVQDGLTLNGTATLGNANGQATASLYFSGNQTLAGNGTVKFGAGSEVSGTNELQVSYGNTLTIASGITITGDSATIGSDGSLVNQGTIDADSSGSSITFNLSSFVNQGTIEATNGGSLTVTGLRGGLGTVVLTGANSSLSLDGTNYTVDSSFSISNGQTLALLGSWTAAPGVTLSATGGTFGLGNTGSLGVITLTNSVLSVDGNYTIAALQSLLAGNSLAVGQGGVLNNTGNTITLNGTTDSLTLDGGTLLGGTVTASGGAKVVVTDSGSVLDGVTLNSDLDMTAAAASATVEDGLTLNGMAAVGDPNGQSTASLSFSGNQTLTGNGTVKFGAGSAMSETNELYVSYGTLTIAPGITITGDSGTIDENGSYENGSLVNQGTIDADGSGSSLTINLSSFASQGTIEATNGGSLTLNDPFNNTGTVKAGAGSTLTVNGLLSQSSSGTIDVDLGGSAPGQFGKIVVSASVFLAGTLNIGLVNGFVPTSGQTFLVMAFTSESGTFATVNNPLGGTFTIFYDPADLTLSAN